MIQRCLLVVAAWLCALSQAVAAGALRDDTPVPLVLLEGDGAARGETGGSLVGERMAGMLPLISNIRFFQVPDRMYNRLVAQIDPDHLAELQSIAASLGLDEREVIAANISVDSMCTVLVRPAQAINRLRSCGRWTSHRHRSSVHLRC